MVKVRSVGLFLLLFWGATMTTIFAQENEVFPTAKDSSAAVVVGATNACATSPSKGSKKNSEALMKEAIVHFDGRRYAKSVSCLDEAIEINEFAQLEAILYYYRAVSKAKLNDHAAATEDYTTAIKINSSKSKYYYNRGMAFFQIGDYEKAEKDFQTTLAMDGPNADIYVKLGFLKQQENDLRGAIEDYTKSIELNPKFSDPYYYRGLIHLQVLLREKGCMDLQKAANLGHQLALRQYDKYCEDY